MGTPQSEAGAAGHRRLLFLFFVVAAIYLFGLGTVPLLEPDEARYAEIPREMLASGDFVTPRLNGAVYLEKPPLYYWGSALSLRVFGETEFGARFFGAAAAAAGVALTFWMGSVMGGPRTGLFAAAILATSFYHYIVGRLNTPDMALAVCLMLALFPAYLHLSERRRGRIWLIVSYAAAGLAFLVKGLVGVVFPAAILLVWLVAAGRLREIPRAFSLTGILAFLAISLPWVVLVQRANPDFLRFFFIREHLLRFTTTIHHHDAPFWYFIPIAAGGLAPWLAFLPEAVRGARRAGERFLAREDKAFLLAWFLLIFLFFSVSRSKLATYAAPLFPPLAVLLGRALDAWSDLEERPEPFLPAATGILLAATICLLPLFSRRYEGGLAEWTALAAPAAALSLAWGAIPLARRWIAGERVVLASFVLLGLFLSSLSAPMARFLGSYKSVKGLSAAITSSLRPGDVVAQYNAFRQGIPFYTKRRTLLVNEASELSFGLQRLPDRARWHLGDEEFLRLWNSEARVLCYFRQDALPLIRERFPRHRLIYRSAEGILVINRPYESSLRPPDSP